VITKRLKISMFLALSGREKRLFLEAFFMHLWVGLLLKIIPFRYIPRFFSSPQFVSLTQEKSRTRSVGKEAQSRHNVPGRKPEDITMIKRAIGRANVVSPWKNKCLVSSLVGRCLLNRRGIVSQLSLGVGKGADGKTVAHAWLKKGDYEIVEKGGDFTELYLF